PVVVSGITYSGGSLHLSACVNKPCRGSLELDPRPMDLTRASRGTRLVPASMVAVLGRRRSLGIHLCSADTRVDRRDHARAPLRPATRVERDHAIRLFRP